MEWEVEEHIYWEFAITPVNKYIYDVIQLVTSGTDTICIKTIGMSRFFKVFS